MQVKFSSIEDLNWHIIGVGMYQNKEVCLRVCVNAALPSFELWTKNAVLCHTSNLDKQRV